MPIREIPSSSQQMTIMCGNIELIVDWLAACPKWENFDCWSVGIGLYAAHRIQHNTYKCTLCLCLIRIQKACSVTHRPSP